MLGGHLAPFTCVFREPPTVHNRPSFGRNPDGSDRFQYLSVSEDMPGAWCPWRLAKPTELAELGTVSQHELTPSPTRLARIGPLAIPILNPVDGASGHFFSS